MHGGVKNLNASSSIECAKFEVESRDSCLLKLKIYSGEKETPSRSWLLQ